MAEQKLIKLKINEREVQVPQGTLVIEATRRIGTEVPSFCYYPGLSLQAACRMYAGGDRRHDRSNGHRTSAASAEIHAGIPADESSAGLSRLRQGRRVR